MQSIKYQETKATETKPMKRFVIREAEAIQTTRPSRYGACCCS